MALQSSPFKDRLTVTKDGMLIWNQEAAILDVTELACKLMASHHVSRTELAHRLKKTKGYVSQLLDVTVHTPAIPQLHGERSIPILTRNSMGLSEQIGRAHV